MQFHVDYLNDYGKASFCSGCDVLLKLNDGSKLPTHSHILAWASGVCKAMLDDGVLFDTSASQKVVVPLTDCSRATAISLLSALYSRWPIQHIRKESWEAIACVAHKLDMKEIEGLCDHVASGANHDGNYDLAFFLQKEEDPEAFRSWIDSAVRFGRDKVLASCEHCIALDHLERFNQIIPDMPPESVVRIVECLRQGIYAKEDRRQRFIPWTTEAFLKRKLENTYQESNTVVTHDWDMKEIVEQCADVQMRKDVGNYWLPFLLKGKGPKTFRNLMDYAVLKGFDKALASCEHCIVIDLMGKFNGIIRNMPHESKGRIVRCLRQTYHALERSPWQLRPWTTADFLPHKFHLGLQVNIGLGLAVLG